ncbi:hypothetical protein SEA_FINKLE_46 [Gordonia phage Finkle]|uniref:Uncharacterized protein n=1 Tax=Gordonia phage Finkle TaxID=2926099 RepID=A0A9E7SXI5_9CAUD|nr:hypothetical protein QEH33_gp46 [Gordonia phage Finkle]UTN92960.1 hypothetical protein SEA_FINKLE_46 [Gordonia phage Finkle]
MRAARRISYVDADGFLACGYDQPSQSELINQQFAELGEESQDPGSDEPA